MVGPVVVEGALSHVHAQYHLPAQRDPQPHAPVLSVKLRQVRGIVSAVVEEKKVTVYYVGRLDLRALNLFIRAFEEKYGRKKEQKDDDMDVATYRREAIISVGGFIAMNILRKVNPEFYGRSSCFADYLPYILHAATLRTASWGS